MPLKIAIVFDTPYEGWDHARHLQQVDKEIGRQDERAHRISGLAYTAGVITA